MFELNVDIKKLSYEMDSENFPYRLNSTVHLAAVLLGYTAPGTNMHVQI